jgi:hypothetical protein
VKQLIVLAAILPLLLVFMAQYALDQKNSLTYNLLQEQVYTAKEQAKQEGCFSESIQEELRQNIGAALGINEDEIQIEATETRQYRINYYDGDRGRGIIHYRVSIPIEKIMAGGRLMGIQPDENITYYTIEGSTASERLPQ